jgi:hypothetical protein
MVLNRPLEPSGSFEFEVFVNLPGDGSDVEDAVGTFGLLGAFRYMLARFGEGGDASEQDDDQAQRPVRHFPGREGCRSQLDHAAGCDDIGNRHAVNFSPLHFLKKRGHGMMILAKGKI